MTTPGSPPLQTTTTTRSPLILRVAQGMAMGSADVVPGVSGGTVALILGIYTTLVGAIESVASTAGSLVRGDRVSAARHWRAVPWGFVLPLGTGMLVALAIGSVVLPPLLEGYPVQTSAAFFGMIVASLAVPWRKVAPRGVREYAVLVGLTLVAFVIMGLPETTVSGEVSLLRIGASMAVAICAMILPGVSGAFLLVALGVYEPVLEAVSSLDLPVLVTAVAGAALGLGLFSKVLGHLLDHHLSITMAGLTGLMIGALRVLWPWGGLEGRLDAPPAAGEAVVALVVAVIGFVLIRTLVVVGERTSPADPD
ncbi:DUF368 domain-containing protein [Euzebya tangerina]|uniref:DUF368 domain-containing protein n=1 Tax=Euzebya tangerina TaxID=591198 RepID=UPI000E322B77|nr:DUF368 domain-containing protein [Euzebya tangerina]